MPIQAFWDNPPENTIIRQEFIKRWTQDDFHTSVDIVHEMMHSVPHTVHIIMDMRRNLSNVLQVVQMFRTINKLESEVAPNYGHAVLVQPGFSVEMSVAMAKGVAKRITENVHTAKSIEEARALLERL